MHFFLSPQELPSSAGWAGVAQEPDKHHNSRHIFCTKSFHMNTSIQFKARNMKEII
jgi:hypothetical protein